MEAEASHDIVIVYTCDLLMNALKRRRAYNQGADARAAVCAGQNLLRSFANDLSTRSTAKIDGRLVLPSYRFVGKWYIYEQNCKDKQPTDRDKKKTKLVEKYSLDW